NIIAKNYFTNVEPHKITAATISQIEESNFDSEALPQNSTTAEAAVIVQQQTIQLPAIQGITVAAAPLSNLHIKEALVTPEEPKET
ncbi:hypothetical protein, partial [Klebsiella aerogenes]|uniref:hypothetical protein n=1 Tax=Klebsiella aerogenes TaxID=548 RepID=UPI0013D0CA1B